MVERAELRHLHRVHQDEKGASPDVPHRPDWQDRDRLQEQGAGDRSVSLSVGAATPASGLHRPIPAESVAHVLWVPCVGWGRPLSLRVRLCYQVCRLRGTQLAGDRSPAALRRHGRELPRLGSAAVVGPVLPEGARAGGVPHRGVGGVRQRHVRALGPVRLVVAGGALRHRTELLASGEPSARLDAGPQRVARRGGAPRGPNCGRGDAGVRAHAGSPVGTAGLEPPEYGNVEAKL
mmetsp:Transcript_52709/g.151947  ORF Transcript_52709/g.151947 Transcript_52709/m.151947 type:complete len:235 (+) Transcript_52709:240-944(+)